MLPLVLVPGLLCTARLFRPQIESLWACGPVMVADHTREAEINNAARYILSHAPPRFALAGLSFGGYLALAMVRLAPERIAKLALLDTSARPDGKEQIATREAFIAAALAGRFDDVVAAIVPRFVHARRRADKTLMRAVEAMAADTGVDAFVRQERAILSRPDSRPFLKNIGCPTLVVVGDGDELTPPDIAREIADGIVGARLAVIPDCGHLSTLECPRTVNSALAEWLKS